MKSLLVAIVGAGLAGLMLAVELGCRGVACAIFDKEEKPPAYPKANTSSARTMEYYRRRGLSNRVQIIGSRLPPSSIFRLK